VLRKLRLDPGTCDAPIAFLDNSAVLTRPWAPWRWVNGVLILAMLGFGGWLLWQPHLAREARLAALDAELPGLQATAVKLRDNSDTRKAEREAREAFVTDLAARTRISDALSELTSSLPDHGWIETLDSDGSVLRIAGHSRDSAADLIAHLSDPAAFRLPELVGPVTRDARQGTERFTIQIKLERSE